mgnify:CR=1 FL=1
MVAIITAEMKKRFIDEFKADADSASVRYYIGISRSEDWNEIQENLFRKMLKQGGTFKVAGIKYKIEIELTALAPSA